MATAGCALVENLGRPRQGAMAASSRAWCAPASGPPSPHTYYSPPPATLASRRRLHPCTPPRHALLTPNVALSVLGRHPEDRTAQLPKQVGPQGLRQCFLVHRDALPTPSGDLHQPHIAFSAAHGCGARACRLAVASSPSPRLAHPGSLASLGGRTPCPEPGHRGRREVHPRPYSWPSAGPGAHQATLAPAPDPRRSHLSASGYPVRCLCTNINFPTHCSSQRAGLVLGRSRSICGGKVHPSEPAADTGR